MKIQLFDAGISIQTGQTDPVNSLLNDPKRSSAENNFITFRWKAKCRSDPEGSLQGSDFECRLFDSSWDLAIEM